MAICDYTDCPATAFTEVVAALASQGYFMQADILYMVENTGFGLWAPLLYIISAFSGLIMMAMGQPPRMYLWFLVGPAVYNWLTIPAEAKGVSWSIGENRQDQDRVWNISEIGFINTSFYRRFHSQPTTIQEQAGGVSHSRTYKMQKVEADSGPADAVHVAYPFLWFDELVSDTAANMVDWLGIGAAPVNDAANCTNTHEYPDEGGDSSGETGYWSILSNSKWPLLENVTAVALHDGDLREALITFMASECGDVLKSHIKSQNFINSAHAHGSEIPVDLFNNGDLATELGNQIIPTPVSLIELLKSNDTKSFRTFLKSGENFITSAEDTEFNEGNWRSVSCSAFLATLVQGFRWESGHAYHQMVRQAKEKGIDEKYMVYSFLYGWRVPDDIVSNDTESGDAIPKADDLCGLQLDPDQQKRFIQSLILMHLFRNELAMAPGVLDTRYTPSERTIDYSQAYQRNIGSKNKYGEIYTWAKMMPYMQGITIFILSMAYPIVCMAVVVPGWHKAILSWMGFFAWAKSWDVGFAVVMLLEEGVWAMLGNSDNAAGVNYRIHRIGENYHQLKLECEDDTCLVPKVETEPTDMDDTMELFEEAFLLAPNMDIDLSNSYYVYLMSALYFAVPAVTGQILLGSKAAASGLVTNAIAPQAQEAGRAAGQAATADVQNRGAIAQAVVGQTAYAKALRASDGGEGSASNLLGRALQSGNAGLDSGLDAAVYGMHQQHAGNREKMAGQELASRNAYSYVIGQASSEFGRFLPRPASAAPGGSSPGTGGSPTTGTDPVQVGSAGWLANVGNGFIGVGAAGDRALAQDTYGGIVAQQTQLGFQNSALGARSGAIGRGHDAAQRRYQAGAEFQAQEAQWTAMRDWSRQVSGNAAAMGVMSGAFSPGQKPTGIDGMSSSGMLDIYSGSGGRAGTGHGHAEGGDRRGTFFYPGEGYMARVNSPDHGFGEFLNSEGGLNAPYQYSYTGSNVREAFTGALVAAPVMLGGVLDEGGGLNSHFQEDAQRLQTFIEGRTPPEEDD